MTLLLDMPVNLLANGLSKKIHAAFEQTLIYKEMATFLSK